MKGLTKRRQVREAFDPVVLKRICEMPSSAFAAYAQKVKLPGNDKSFLAERFYFHQDHGSKILAVAHLDTVWQDRTCHVLDTPEGPLALSGALDDRLGAYTICELLPKMGIQFDLLLTTDEERCDTTARAFKTKKQYNWLIEFDRGGTDTVMYNYETKDLKRLVLNSGSDVGFGSYSDICALEDLGVAGFNWGVGYRDYHGPRGHVWLDDYWTMIANFLRFYSVNAEVRIPHVKATRHSDWGSHKLSLSTGDTNWFAYIPENQKSNSTSTHLIVSRDPRVGDDDAFGAWPDTDRPAPYASKHVYVDRGNEPLLDDCPLDLIPLRYGECEACGIDWWMPAKRIRNEAGEWVNENPKDPRKGSGVAVTEDELEAAFWETVDDTPIEPSEKSEGYEEARQLIIASGATPFVAEMILSDRLERLA